jgi:hypothetical protein
MSGCGANGDCQSDCRTLDDGDADAKAGKHGTEQQ